MESVGFKEWAVVCEAMGRGKQSIILRKGGIAEGRDGFSFKYPEFFLFPTWFHEQPHRVREIWNDLGSSPANAERPTPNAEHRSQRSPATLSAEALIEIRYFAQLESAHTITSWQTAQALEPLHILQPEVVRERFEYDEAPGLHIAFVRVFVLDSSWIFPNEKKYGGCRSWVKLPVLPNNLLLQPVLSDQEHNRVRAQFLEIIKARVCSGGL